MPTDQQVPTFTELLDGYTMTGSPLEIILAQAAQIAVLRSRLAALAAAGKPFVEAEALPGAPDEGFLIGWLDEHPNMLTVGDLRRLKAALAGDSNA